MEQDFSPLETIAFKAFCERHKDHVDDSFLNAEEREDETPESVGF